MILIDILLILSPLIFSFSIVVFGLSGGFKETFKRKSKANKNNVGW
jgi:hypothetical protein